MRALIMAVLAVSDFHLACGEAAPTIDDFPREAAQTHLRMLAAYLRRLPAEVPCEHVLNGDWFDFLAVPTHASIDPWSEPDAMNKARVILAAYGDYLAGLRDLLAWHPHLRYRIVIGNHDLEFRWPAVQALLIGALTEPGEKPRVTFHEEYLVADRVLHVHGDMFDKASANPSERRAFKSRAIVGGRLQVMVALIAAMLGVRLAEKAFWWMPSFWAISLSSLLMFFAGRKLVKFVAGRRIFMLNVRVSSRLHASLGMWLKRWFFPEIGRRADHGDMYVLGLARKPYAALPVLCALLLELFRHDPDEWPELRDVIWTTTGADLYQHALMELCWRRPSIDHVIAGHTHVRETVTHAVGSRRVRYYNGGLSGLQVHTSKPHVVCRTFWPKTETFLKRIAYHWKHAFAQAFFSTAAYGSLPALLFLLPTVPVLHALRWPAVIVAALLLLVRQATAAYVDETFFRFSPVETLVYADSTVQVTPLEYRPERDAFEALSSPSGREP